MIKLNTTTEENMPEKNILLKLLCLTITLSLLLYYFAYTHPICYWYVLFILLLFIFLTEYIDALCVWLLLEF